MLDADQVRVLVSDQLNSIQDRRCREDLERYVVTPRKQIRNWDYGAEGETFRVWLVADFRGTRTGIAYSEHGFGPQNPWGLVFVDDEWFGQDSCWYLRMEDAFRESMAWEGPNPPDYEIP